MRIIQSQTPRPLNVLAAGPGGLVAAASGTLGAPGDVEVWDATTGDSVFVHSMPDQIAGSLAFAPDGRHLFLGRPGAIALLNAHTGAATTARPFGPAFPRFALSRDGTTLVAAVEIDRYSHVACLKVEPDLTLQPLWADGQHSMQDFASPAVSPDGTRAAVNQRALSFVRSTLTIRDAATGKVLVTVYTDAASPAQQLAFTADGSKLLVRTDGRAVGMYDAATGAPAGELVHRGRPYVTAVAVHPRGPVACARTDGTVTFWDAERREQLRALDWKLGRLVSLAFSPDGALGAAGTEDGKLVVWDVDL